MVAHAVRSCGAGGRIATPVCALARNDKTEALKNVLNCACNQKLL